LEVALETDLLLIVMDASSPWVDAQLETVNQVLDELGADSQPRVPVFNKTDLLKDTYARKRLELAYPGTLFVSARTGEGFEELKQQIGAVLLEQKKAQAMGRIIARKSKALRSELTGTTPV
jgi:GTP-binding protein HflX